MASFQARRVISTLGALRKFVHGQSLKFLAGMFPLCVLLRLTALEAVRVETARGVLVDAAAHSLRDS